MKKQYRKSDLNIVEDVNIKLITNRHSTLINCNLVINTAENTELEYELVGQSLKDIKLKRHEKMQVLSKLGDIAMNELQMLDYMISPTNVYLEANGNVRLCERKINTQSDTVRNEQLLNQLIALTGYMLEDIDYQELLEVNSIQLQASKKLPNITKITTLEMFNMYINELLTAEIEKLHNEQVVISKVKYKSLTNNKLAYRISLVVVISVLLFLLTYSIPFKNKEVALYEAYQNTDNETILKIIKDVNISRLSNEEKLISSITVVNSQIELNDEQKANIIQNLNNKTNNKILDYWLYVGKGEFEEANNKAIALSDADMQMYALLLLINEVQNDEDLEAEERKELVDGYEKQLEDLKDKKMEVNGEQNE